MIKRKSKIIKAINDKIDKNNDKIQCIDKLIILRDKNTQIPTDFSKLDSKTDRSTGKLEDRSYGSMINCLEEIGRIYEGEIIYFDMNGLSRLQCSAVGSLSQFLKFNFLDTSEDSDVITNDAEFVNLTGTAWLVLEYLYNNLPSGKTAYQITADLEETYPGKTNPNTIRQIIAKLTRYHLIDSITRNSTTPGPPFRIHKLNHSGKLAYYLNKKSNE